ncbi:chorismate-binding protein [Sphingobacterium sp.]|uniref:anthranilate synthase component I family protein n=1 Tax=Sphingobacterium sp. TaxID=341027 RepID=UPI0028AEF450|nr:chorismate-binding protein [Sphingobacterium sp.]
MAKAIFETDSSTFLLQALNWSKGFDTVCLFQSNGFQNQYSKIGNLLAIGAKEEFSANVGSVFTDLENFKSRYPDTLIPGFLSYDLKNEVEDLQTNHPNPLGFPDAYFFIPQILIEFNKDTISITAEDPQQTFEEISMFPSLDLHYQFKGKIHPRMDQEGYFDAFNNIQRHIYQGDIYEANLCQEFFDEQVELDNPEALYLRLNSLSPTPFSSFIKVRDKYIISASPERFLAKRGKTLVSQPIKGTAARGKNAKEDEELRNNLARNPKEIAENVMIVDLVRNDLTRSAIPGTVEVTEKLGIYTFEHVHQMISTVSCEMDESLTETGVIRNTFPAGSMTGAPKISAMKLCDKYETSRRGVYSGAIGYFSADGDFDFNVVIRTILFNKTQQYLSFHTGSAITVDANAAHEFAECYTKASAILKALEQKL